jgi:hypothetical protein
MKRTKRTKVITLAESMLKFASLQDGDLRHKIDEIFKPHASFLWNAIPETDVRGKKSLKELHFMCRRRLMAIINGSKNDRQKVLGQIVTEVHNASPRAEIQRVPIGALPGVPEIVIQNGRVAVRHRWLTTGAHAFVVFGLLEMFVDGLVDRLALCQNCRAFYLKTPALRVACSPACRWQIRKKDIAENVRTYRRKQRRNRA